MNDDEIMDFVAMTKDRPLDIRFIEYMPFDGNNWSSAKMIPFIQVVKKIEESLGKRLLKESDGPNDTAKTYKLDGYQGRCLNSWDTQPNKQIIKLITHRSNNSMFHSFKLRTLFFKHSYPS